jgi:5'-3' exonuclease
MGVKGLWKLLLPIGRRISLETLRGRVLAIDASIWLTQFLKAMRDPETGQVTASAHLIGYMRRICRLLFHQIRPVFVFDGRAPEIKRRELLLRRQKRNEFVAQGENIQRYARKLIHETLLRQQQKQIQQDMPNLERLENESDTKETGAFVRGFHPDDGDPTKSFNDKSEADEVIDLSSETKVAPPGELKSAAATSDWDIPLAVAAMEEAKELDALESASQVDCTDGEIEYEDFILPSDAAANPWSRGKKRAPQISSVAEIASLPPTERKDAIETVLRQRRLLSRKEFLPAADDPVQFSNVQLSNFLKSCQLNKDIVSMAKRAVLQQSEAEGGGGEFMASDRTTRVELIREGKIDSAPPMADALTRSAMWHAESIQPKDDEASEDDVESDAETNEASDSEGSDAIIQWDDPVAHGDSDAAIQKALWNDSLETKPSPKKRRHIVIDDDEEDGDDTEVEILDDWNASHIGNRKSNFESTSLKSQNEDQSNIFAAAGPMFRDIGQDDDDVDWEDVEDVFGALELQRESLEISVPQPCSGESTSAPNANVPDGHPDEDEVDYEVVENYESGGGDINDSEVNDRHHFDSKPAAQSIDFFAGNPKSFPVEVTPTDSCIGKSPVFSKGTSDALIHAQATAAQLTNWAGRAFRRAVAEANGGHALEGSAHSSSSDPEECDNDNSDGDSPPVNQSVVSSSSPMEDNRIDNLPVNSREKAMSLPKKSHASRALATLSSICYDAAFLERNDAEWTAERNRRERDMETISDDMLLEVKQLLQLFGIPYIEAPSEAEAQCAVLESLGLVDGIVTEDSDVFVFGGKTVYKNIFEEQKYAEVYNAADAEREMKLGRNSMVALAMLLGGDYTEGAKGVGIVNAMEVLDTFDVSRSVQDGLKNFRTWLDGFNPPEVHAEEGEDSEVISQKVKESAFHMKHMSARTRWTVPQNFPAETVIKAYVDPVVDKSTDPFKWGGKWALFARDADRFLHNALSFHGLENASSRF